jgi:hypothetical protein
MGEQLGGFLYGTIVVLAVIVAGAKAYPDAPGHVLALVVVTTGVFWLAHVYAHGLAHSVSRAERLSIAELGHIARHEGALVKAGGPPAIPLLLAMFGAMSPVTAYWVALAIGLTVLGIDGLLFARALRMRPLAAIAVTAGNLALGVVLVVLKLLVTH